MSKRGNTMLYKHPGPHKIHGSDFDYIVVPAEEVEKHLDEGWSRTTTGAKELAQFAEDEKSRIEKEEREKAEAEEKAKADALAADEKAKADQAEKDRIAAEEKAKADAKAAEKSGNKK